MKRYLGVVASAGLLAGMSDALAAGHGGGGADSEVATWVLDVSVVDR